MMTRSVVSLCSAAVLLSVGVAALADAAADEPGGVCRPVSFQALSELDKTYQFGEFRIHYAVSGSHALESLEDANHNGRPDRIDDLALQLRTAQTLYSQFIGLRHPLEQARYTKAGQINVYVLALKGGNGQAFDEVVSEQLHGQRMACGLRLFIDHRVRPSRNLTPAHELFHLYQYGYSMFKSPWYLEGMARWVESFFRAGQPAATSKLGDAAMTCEQAYTKGYAASGYWQQRATASGTAARVLPHTLRAARFTDGRAVIEADRLQGGEFLLGALQALESASVAVAGAQGLPPYDWPESVQRSTQFDSLICSTVDALVR